MPTYSYTCKKCTHSFDIHQAFADASLTECPDCGGRLKKNFGTVGISFKGSGFYRTDSRETKTGGSPSPAKSSESASGSASESSAAPSTGSSESSTSPAPAPAAATAAD